MDDQVVAGQIQLAGQRAAADGDHNAADPDDKDALFEPAMDKTFRQPTFYDLPDEVKNL